MYDIIIYTKVSQNILFLIDNRWTFFYKPFSGRTPFQLQIPNYFIIHFMKRKMPIPLQFSNYFIIHSAKRKILKTRLNQLLLLKIVFCKSLDIFV